MKKLITVLALVLTLSLMLGLTITASAEEALTASVATAAELELAIIDAAGEDIDITLTADVEPVYIETAEDQTVTVKGDYTMDSATLYGDGTVVIEVKAIKAESNTALSTYGSVKATVKADISTIDGNGLSTVSSGEESELTITGNVTTGSYSGYDTSAGAGIYAEDDAKVTVTGNVTGGSAISLDPEGYYADAGAGICAYENATVKVTGNVTAGNSHGYYAYGADGIYASGNVSVEVIGNVTGGTVTETHGYDYDGEQRWAAGCGIDIDLDYGGTTKIKVTGNVTGGAASEDGLGGYGIIAVGYDSYSKYDITVIGDVTAGEGAGAMIDPAAGNKLYVDGTITGTKGFVALEYDGDDDGLLMYRALPTYAEAKEAGYVTDYEEYLEALFRGAIQLVNEDLITEDQFMNFAITIYNPVLKLAGAELPVPFDPEAPESEALMDEVEEKLNAFHAENPNAGDLALAAVEANDSNNYAAFMELVENAKDPAEDVSPSVTVWKLVSGIPNELSNNYGHLANVAYLIHTDDAEGGTITPNKATVKGEAITTVMTKAEEGYTVKTASTTAGQLKGGKQVWNLTLNKNYEGGILVSAEFVNPNAPQITPPTDNGNPPTSDLNTVTFAAMAVMALLAGFCVTNLVRIRRNEQ